MTWEWSHTAEGVENARNNVFEQDDMWLIDAWAEIQCRIPNEDGEDGLDFDRIGRAISCAKGMPNSTLAEAIWEFAEEQRTCDNGGFRAWCCPFGCHTVSFDEK